VNDLSGTPAPPLLEVRHLSKSFGAVRALKEMSMTLRAGEVVALAGDNGAGKTTLIKAISGVYAPSGGEILLDGQPVRFASPQEARDRGIETIYQDLALADNLTIGANIFLGREPMRKALGFLPVLDRRRMAEAARETMARLDFHVTRMDAPVSNFSGGQRQAVAIGRAVYWR
jgi:simple sugar transport system ATP-binding protein